MDLYDQVYDACQEGDLEALQRLLPGNPTQWRSPWGLSLLHVVVRTPHLHVLNWLVTFSVDVNEPTVHGTTPLMWACYCSREDRLRLSLDQGVMIRWLLDHGARVHAADPTGCTALHYACSEDWIEGATLLLEWGADPEARDHQDHLPEDLSRVMSSYYATLCDLLGAARRGCGLK
jgi:ankyrin repeat protein